MTVEHFDLSEPGRGLCSCGARPQAGQSIPAWWRQHIAPPVTAASGADQPTLRDQLAEALCDDAEDGPAWDYAEDYERDYWRRKADRLFLPLIEADRERAKAEAAAEALEEAANDWDASTNHVCDAPGELRARAAALRGSTGGGT